MLDQLAKANVCLDTADLFAVRDVQERCIAEATEVEHRVTKWLRSGAHPDDQVDAVEGALRDLSDRLAMQSSAKRHW